MSKSTTNGGMSETQTQYFDLIGSYIARRTVVDLLTDATPFGSIGWTEGDVIHAGGYRYRVAAGTAADEHLTTDPGGVKLYVLPSNGRFYVEAFNADPTGATDSTAAFSAAETAARLSPLKPKVAAGEGVFLLNATVTITGVDFIGAGRTSTILRAGMTDGSPCLYFHGDSNNFASTGFSIMASKIPDFTDYLAGTANAQNCIGMKIGDERGGNWGTRMYLQDIGVSGCNTGWEIYGYIGRGQNLWATACDLGFKLTEFNDAHCDLTIENCKKGFEINICNGSSMKILEEGAVEQSGYVSSTIDDALGLHLIAPYFERDVSVPVLKIGGTVSCSGITMTGLRLSVAGSPPETDMNVAPIELNDVDGVYISGSASTSHRHSVVKTTLNTKNLTMDIGALSDSIIQEQGGQLAPARNFFPNSHFDAWFRGWPRVDVTRAVVSQETSLVRTGQNAVRLTLEADQTAAGSMGFVFDDGHLANSIKGKSVSLYIWVWIPNASGWDANDTTSQINLAFIGLYSNGTGAGTTETATHHTVRGAWNLLRVEKTIPTDATIIGIYVSILVPSGSDGSEYVVVDSVYLIDEQGLDYKVQNGRIVDCSNFKQFGDLTQSYASAAPTNPDMTYKLGDVIWNNAPMAGGTMGWVCTTAGAGGTAVFKTFGDVSA